MNIATPHASLSTAPGHSGRSQLLWLGAAGTGIVWAAVIVISVFSPDMVTGSQHDHFAIAAVVTWIWGFLASRSMFATLVAQRGHADRLADIWLLVGGIAVVWIIAAFVVVVAPVFVTGTDPTRLPIAALLAPIAALLLTGTFCQMFTSLTGPVAHPGGVSE
jgi:hypothetical protein